MARCKITVLERSFRKEYVDLYVENERKKMLGPCETFSDGQVFITDAVSGPPAGSPKTANLRSRSVMVLTL